jgi:sortase (surface protein transpeptidase)
VTLRRLLIAAGVSLALTAACGAPTLDDTSPSGVVQGASANVQIAVAPRATPVGEPTSITIPALGVTDEVVPVGLAADGSMQVPDVHESGWYRLGVKPGEPGPAVIVGHVNYGGTPGALGRIGELKPGALITVKDTAGVERTFAVDVVTVVPKAQYASRTAPLVFGPVADPELRLVTCSGSVVDHNYLDNTVVSAHLVA